VVKSIIIVFWAGDWVVKQPEMKKIL